MVIAAQWAALSRLRRENEDLRRYRAQAEQARQEIVPQVQTVTQHRPNDEAMDRELSQLRAQVHSLRQGLEAATNRASQSILAPEQAKLARSGDGRLPRRVAPPAGPLPRDFGQYRLQMRYTGLTPVLQKREMDGSYTDLVEGPREIGLGEKHLFVLSWPDASRMNGSWLIIDLDTGEVTEKVAVSVEESPDSIPEGKAAKWICRDPNPNRPDDQNWKVLFE